MSTPLDEIVKQVNAVTRVCKKINDVHAANVEVFESLKEADDALLDVAKHNTDGIKLIREITTQQTERIVDLEARAQVWRRVTTVAVVVSVVAWSLLWLWWMR